MIPPHKTREKRKAILQLYFAHHEKCRRRTTYWKINPTKNHDEKLIPTDGGMYDTPLSTIGVEMYFTKLFGRRRCHSQNGIGSKAPTTMA